jgi:hypothetical protein
MSDGVFLVLGWEMMNSPPFSCSFEEWSVGRVTAVDFEDYA